MLKQLKYCHGVYKLCVSLDSRNSFYSISSEVYNTQRDSRFSQMRITVSWCVVPFPSVNFHILLLSQRYCYCIISNGYSRSVIENKVSLAWCLVMTCVQWSAFYTAVNVHTSYLVGFHRQVRRSELPSSLLRLRAALWRWKLQTLLHIIWGDHCNSPDPLTISECFRSNSAVRGWCSGYVVLLLINVWEVFEVRAGSVLPSIHQVTRCLTRQPFPYSVLIVGGVGCFIVSW